MNESYFGCDIEVIRFIEDIQCYLVKVNDDKFALYDINGEDALGLSTIDSDELEKEVDEVRTL